ncbi:hydrogenase nickel incorporation protein HypB [Olsenella urininfantis]|uniref:hydrogenase nickel incorporation protein HypB n=1 Tax=Olsenella urininfantis TaxID=1871033 RepID=UPI00098458ED|nr:hydrogenase nickel incorporation protein HypB [Olsenella urininfantis]
MENVRVIEVKENVFASNIRNADELRARMRGEGCLLINLMSSPGSGKTTLLSATIDALKDEMGIGVIEADVDSAVDAKTIQMHGARAVQVHTGGMCHLDAGMCDQGLAELDTTGLDLVFIENVGNLICPAEFDTGAARKVMILSVPEGHDKPLKYPLIFEVSDLVLISKCDVAPYFDFDMEQLRKNVADRRRSSQILPLSAKTGEGMDAWLQWLRDEVAAWKQA